MVNSKLSPTLNSTLNSTLRVHQLNQSERSIELHGDCYQLGRDDNSPTTGSSALAAGLWGDIIRVAKSGGRQAKP
jgi:hypothetical protein